MKYSINEQYIFLSSLNEILNDNFLRIYTRRIEEAVDYRVKQLNMSPTAKHHPETVYKVLLLFIRDNKIKDKNLELMIDKEDIYIENKDEYNEIVQLLGQYLQILERGIS